MGKLRQNMVDSEPSILQSPCLHGRGRKGRLKAACRGGVGQALTTPKCSSAGSLLRQKLAQASARDEGKTRIDTPVQDGQDSAE